MNEEDAQEKKKVRAASGLVADCSQVTHERNEKKLVSMRRSTKEGMEMKNRGENRRETYIEKRLYNV